MRKILLYIIVLSGLILANTVYGQELLNVKPGAVMKLDDGALVYINGGVKVDGNGSTNNGELIFAGSAANQSELKIDGNLTIDGVLSNEGGRLWLIGSLDAAILTNTYPYLIIDSLFINKTSGLITLNSDLLINNALVLINGQLNVNYSDLIFEIGSTLFANTSFQSARNLFSDDNCIFFTKGRNYAIPANDAGKVVFNIDPLTASAADYSIFLPGASTDELFSTSVIDYAPTWIKLYDAIDANINYDITDSIYISINITPEEHPAVEVENKSLVKYWSVISNGITLNTESVDLEFGYNQNDIPSGAIETNFEVLLFTPLYDDPNGYWLINPGDYNDVVEFNQDKFYANSSEFLDGNWVAGEQSAAKATYFSRQDGDFDDPNTWSYDSYGGAPASRAPNKRSDRVFIGQFAGDFHEVTLKTDEIVNILTVESGGLLLVDGDYSVTGDTFNLKTGATFKVAHSAGFAAVGGALSATGCIQTDVRLYSSSASYYFYGGTSGSFQFTGDGLPNFVDSLFIDKNIGATTVLEKDILINKALVIEEGTFDISGQILNGSSVGKTLTMNGGEFIVNVFPNNFDAPTFTVGTIHFESSGDAIIPSVASTPGVLQYYNLKISGERNGEITFQSSGETKISNELDLSELTFNPVQALRFNTNGSTITFNGGNQTIPHLSSTYDATYSDLQLAYNILKLEGSGTKSIQTVAGLKLIVKDDLLINGITLDGATSNIKVQGDWINDAGTFVTGTNSLEMNSPIATLYNDINILNGASNEFYDLMISGDGIVRTDDNILINNDIALDSSNFELVANTISIYGDWLGDYSTFEAATSTVIFTGDATEHTLSHNYNDISFYNLQIDRHSDNTKGYVYAEDFEANRGIYIENNINLDGSVIKTLGTFLQLDGTITRNGTYGGHIWGAMRKEVAANDVSNFQFELGSADNYTPIEFDFNGTGGITGLFQVESDTIDNTPTIPIYLDGTGEIQPENTNFPFDELQSVLRQWKISVPISSSFTLGARNFDVTATFVPADHRNSADFNLYSPQIYTGDTWVIPHRVNEPYVGTRTNESIEFIGLDSLGTLVIGEIDFPTYYSRADGSWKSAATWSTQKYGGIQALEYPPTFARVYIGNGNRVEILNGGGLDAPATGLVVLDSSGTLAFDRNATLGRVADGGEFQMLAHSTIEIGHIRGTGTNTNNNNGNVQVETVDFNYGEHNQGHFIFDRDNSGAGQEISVGVGIPDTVRTFIVNNDDKVPPDGVQLWKDIVIMDSLSIIDGDLIAGANGHSYDISLHGNLRVTSDGGFDAMSSTFTFEGVGQDTIDAPVTTTDTLSFYNFEINKIDSTGDVVLSENTGIMIDNQLIFASTNESQVVAREDGAFVRIDKNAPGTWLVGEGPGGASSDIGWVDGELQRWIPTGNLTTTATYIEYPVGNDGYFTPFYIGFEQDAGTDDVAGYVGSVVIEGDHPNLGDYRDVGYPSVAPTRTALRFWRLLLPNSSTFDLGTRKPRILIGMANPTDLINVDTYICMDVAMWNGTNTIDVPPPLYDGWIHFTCESDNHGICGDTRNYDNTNDWEYDPGLAYDDEIATVHTDPYTSAQYFDFGTTLTVDDATLLGDFVVGNTNEEAIFRSFYSIGSGLWHDETSWSTDSHTGTENRGSTINFDYTLSGTDSLFYPLTQYDNVFVGAGDTIKIEGASGHYAWGVGSGRSRAYGKTGPNIVLLEGGTLDLSEGIAVGASLNVKPGATIIIGANNGIDIDQPLGSVYCPNKAFADSINLVYSPTGSVPVGRTTYANYRRCCMLYAWAYDSGNLYIERTRILEGTTELMNCYSGSDTDLRDELFFGEYTARVDAGSSYTLEVTKGDNNNNRDLTFWIDDDKDGDFDDADRLLNSVDFDGFTDSWSFTVPTNTPPGLTFMQVRLHGGEYEIYGLIVENDDYGNITQIMGDAVPEVLKNLTIHSQYGDATNRATVESQGDILILEDFTVVAGQYDIDSDSLKIMGDMIIDTIDAIIPNDGVVYFMGGTTSEIKTNASFTDANLLNFDNLTVDKGTDVTVADQLNIKMSLTVNDKFDFRTNTPIVIDDNVELVFEEDATLLGSSNGNTVNDFSKERMFFVSGNSNGGKITKEYPTDDASEQTFVIPIGLDGGTEDNEYHAADLSLDPDGNLSGDPSLSLVLVDAKHPELINELYGLKKYWTISTTDLDYEDIEARTFEFHYDNIDTVGDGEEYIPGLWWDDTAWEINVADYDDISAYPSPISVPTNSAGAFGSLLFLNGDWTIGIPNSLLNDLTYYSRIDGNWSNPMTWTNDPVTNYPSSYYPGALRDDDAVNIDCNSVAFDITDEIVHIGAMNIACRTACTSELTFSDDVGTTIPHKSLHLHDDLVVCANGAINRENLATNNNRDTLTVYTSLENLSDGLDDAGVIHRITQQNTASTTLDETIFRFSGGLADGEDTELTGEGSWFGLTEILMDKTNTNGLEGSFVISSESFANQTAVVGEDKLKFTLNRGMLEKAATTDLYLSADGNDVEMGIYSGIEVTGGTIRTRGDLITEVQTEININGGDLYIGDGIDDNLLYKTGTTINVIDGDMNIAGAFARYATSSAVELNVSPNNIINVMLSGTTEMDKISFDLYNANSTLLLDESFVIVHNPSSSLNPDVFIGVETAASEMVNDSYIQIGTATSTFTAPDNTFYVQSILPIENLEIYGENNETYLLGASMDISDRLYVGEDSEFSINERTLNLYGDLEVDADGTFTAVPNAATTEPWQVSLVGDEDQLILNNKATGDDIGLEFYNLRIDKREYAPSVPTKVTFGRMDGANLEYNSTVTVRNNLEFSLNNESYIDVSLADATEEEYLYFISDGYGSEPRILRNGYGHIYGRVCHEVTTDNFIYLFPVGAENDLTHYYPAEIEFSGTLTQSGIISVKYTRSAHPDLDVLLIDDATDLQMYWDVSDDPRLTNGTQILPSNTFDIGTADFELKTSFLTSDIPAGSNIDLAEHFVYTNPDWETTTKLQNTNTSLTSEENLSFGDYIVSSSTGLDFYSIANGSWTNASNWSNDSYGGTAASTYPNTDTDIVHIGDDKEITLPADNNYTLRSVSIEDEVAGPGTLNIQGYDTRLMGKSFSLADDCYLAMQHWGGLDASILFEDINLGRSHYKYNLNTSGQITGIILPSEILSLTVDNQTIDTTNQSLSINYDPLSILPLTIVEGIYVENGRLQPFNKMIELEGDLTFENKGYIRNATGLFDFAATSGTNSVYLSGDTTLILEQVRISSEGVDFDITGSSLDQADLDRMFLITDTRSPKLTTPQLIFNSPLGTPCIIDVRTADGTVVYNSANAITRNNSTGHVNGRLALAVSTSHTSTDYDFHIGSDDGEYKPVQFERETSGVDGFVTLSFSRGSSGSFPDAHSSFFSGAVDYMEGYWTVDSSLTTAEIDGTLIFNYIDSDITTIEANADFLGRWREEYEGAATSGWNTWNSPNVTFDNSANTVTTISLSHSDLHGDWTFANEAAFLRIFYSLNSADWNAANAWTVNADHATGTAGGLYPNMATDSVIIANNHEMKFIENVTISGIQIGNPDIAVKNGLLNTNNFTLSGEYFEMIENSTLYVTSADGISQIGETDEDLGNVRMSEDRTFGSGTNLNTFVYYGSTNQVIGSGLPTNISTLIISNDGTSDIYNPSARDNIVLIDKNINVDDELRLDEGNLNLDLYSITGSISAAFELVNTSMVSIGGTNSIATALSGYGFYTLPGTSYVEFSGSDQLVSGLPTNFHPTLLGLPNVNLINAGDKTVSQALLVRGGLFNSYNSNLLNNVGVNSLRVIGTLTNEADINNSGDIEVGN